MQACSKLTHRVNPPEACGRLTARKCEGESGFPEDKLIHCQSKVDKVYMTMKAGYSDISQSNFVQQVLVFYNPAGTKCNGAERVIGDTDSQAGFFFEEFI